MFLHAALVLLMTGAACAQTCTITALPIQVNAGQVLCPPGQGPSTPTGLAATPGNGQVALSWNSIGTPATYNIKRSSVSGGPYVVIATQLSSFGTAYTDATVSNGNTYYYVVSAFVNPTESPNSAEVRAVLPASAPGCATTYCNPSTVLVVYQLNSGPEAGTGTVDASRWVAQYYITKRNIPSSNLLGIASHIDNCGGPGCPNANMAHGDSTGIWGGSAGPASMALLQSEILGPIQAFISAHPNIKYIVPVYGVPVTVAGSVNYGTLSIDTILAGMQLGQTADGIANPYYSGAQALPPHIDVSTSKVLIVSRIDAPTAALAAALVDKAIAGESGIKGAGWFDYNSVAGWAGGGGATFTAAYNYCGMIMPVQVCNLNDQVKTGGMIGDPTNTVYHSAPMTAWAWGGYNPYDDGSQAKAYTFVPGAVAASMNSNSAVTIRRPTPGAFTYWFLLNGATATWGAVNEPYSPYYTRGDMLLWRLWKGYTFGEACISATQQLNWMVTCVGDPLYRPILK